jgi:hypothetical protein
MSTIEQMTSGKRAMNARLLMTLHVIVATGGDRSQDAAA